MKKILAVLVAVFSCLIFISCGKDKGATDKGQVVGENCKVTIIYHGESGNENFYVVFSNDYQFMALSYPDYSESNKSGDRYYNYTTVQDYQADATKIIQYNGWFRVIIEMKDESYTFTNTYTFSFSNNYYSYFVDNGYVQSQA